MIKRYNVRLVTEAEKKADKLTGDFIFSREAKRIKADGQFEEFKAMKSEMVTILKAQEAEAKQAIADRKAKIAAISGLKELENAISAYAEYTEEFTKMMDDESNDGVNPPVRPIDDIGALKAAYPVAAAYIKAEIWKESTNYAKSGAGEKALEKIINGEDYKQVIADMETEWKAYCGKHIWD